MKSKDEKLLFMGTSTPLGRPLSSPTYHTNQNPYWTLLRSFSTKLATAGNNPDLHSTTPIHPLAVSLTLKIIYQLSRRRFYPHEVTAATAIQAYWRSYRTRRSVKLVLLRKKEIIIELHETEKTYYKSIQTLIHLLNTLPFSELYDQNFRFMKSLVENLEEISMISQYLLVILQF
jgi:hypothetical protein